MIDFHCHILPGLDDGSSSIDESIAMARGLVAAGYSRVCCTPHCMKGYYEHSPQQVREATLMLQADLDHAGIDLTLGPGMEYTLDECLKSFADDFMPLGDSRLVLCEAPHHANPHFVTEGLELILSKGFIPLIAHPERTDYIYRALRGRSALAGAAPGPSLEHAELGGTGGPQKLRNLLRKLFARRTASQQPEPVGSRLPPPILPAACLFHANLGSFVDFYPAGTQQRAYELLKAGQYHCLASDLHNSFMAAKILQPGTEKFQTNPLLQELAGRTPNDLEQIAEHALQKKESGEQQEFDL